MQNALNKASGIISDYLSLPYTLTEFTLYAVKPSLLMSLSAEIHWTFMKSDKWEDFHLRREKPVSLHIIQLIISVQAAPFQRANKSWNLKMERNPSVRGKKKTEEA